MSTSLENDREEPACDSVVRGRRVLAAMLVAVGLCAAGFLVCWLFLLAGSTPQSAFERTVDRMVWICPALMILALPLVLLFFEKRRQGSPRL